MFEPLKKIFRQAPKPARPHVPDGERYYVIGDIHGRLDLFEAMIEAIEDDDSHSPEAASHVILLGDLVDRGPDSAGVIRKARKWQSRRSVRILAGNHEEMFLDSMDDVDTLRHFLKHGGRETILSYGIKPKQYLKLELEELQREIRKAVPKADREFIRNFEEMIVAGDYLFVHAGIDPLVALDEQKRSDMLWIRDRFLRHEGPLSKVVVHGHTIFDDVLDCGNRIGIDTGAFRSGLLTALVLEGEERRTIQIAQDAGELSIINREFDI